MRLNRFLAAAGVGSRRGCDELIREGRVQVNGETATLPGPEIDPDKDDVRLDGERVRPPRQHLYLAMNKPAGYVTTHSDERARRTVEDLLGAYRGRVFSIGRLDRASEGLLLFTNDGELANRLLHPRYRQDRVYLAWVRPFPNLETQRRIEAGVSLGPGEQSGPARVRVLGQKGDAARVRITLREGKNREVRRIFASQGIAVLALRRTAFAGITLGALAPGSTRPLTEEELDELRRRTGLPLDTGAAHVRSGKPVRSRRPPPTH